MSIFAGSRQAGHDILFAPKSCVYHKYTTRNGIPNYYFFERNRWWLLLTYYKGLTLLLLAPRLFVDGVCPTGLRHGHGLFRGEIAKLRILSAAQQSASVWHRHRTAQGIDA